MQGLTNFLVVIIYQDLYADIAYSLDLVKSLEATMKMFRFLKDDIIVLGLITSIYILILMPWFPGNQLHFVFVFLDEHDVPCSFIIKFIYASTFYSVLVTAFCFYLTCLCLNANSLLHCQLLHHQIMALSNADANTSCYQECVGERLKSCVNHHGFIKR